MDDSGIKLGMSIEAVRQLLRGWTDHPVQLAGNSRNPIHVWDFTPPQGSARKTIRVTFDSSGVVASGDPATQAANAEAKKQIARTQATIDRAARTITQNQEHLDKINASATPPAPSSASPPAPSLGRDCLS